MADDAAHYELQRPVAAFTPEERQEATRQEAARLEAERQEPKSPRA